MRLIEEWKRSWRWSSVRFSWVVGILAGIITANQTLAIGLILIIPNNGWKYLVAAIVALVVIGIPWFFRVTRFTKEDGDGAA